jgi:transposase
MELHDNDPDRLLGDKGYDSDNIRNDLAERGIEPVIPPRSNRKVPIEYDREAYKRRNLIERCVNRLKQFRRIATRYEKTARAYLSMLCIASALIWIKTVNTALALRIRSIVLGHTMTQNTDVQGLQSKAEACLAPLKEEKLVTRIAVLSTLLGHGKITKRLMIGMSIETHKMSPDFDQKKCNQAKGRIMQALGDIDCDVFIEMDR